MLFENTWNRIVEWFHDRSERGQVGKKFQRNGSCRIHCWRCANGIEGEHIQRMLCLQARVLRLDEYGVQNTGLDGAGIVKGRNYFHRRGNLGEQDARAQACRLGMGHVRDSW